MSLAEFLSAARERRRMKTRQRRDALPTLVLPKGLLDSEAPDTWTDHEGRTWRTPRSKGRLKMKIRAHAALRDFVLKRDCKCMWCGDASGHPWLVADHIISRRNGGTHHPDNLQALCESCNAAKVGLVDARNDHNSQAVR